MKRLRKQVKALVSRMNGGLPSLEIKDDDT